MKKLILGLIIVFLFGTNLVQAASLQLQIAAPAKSPYYLCIYGEGCIRVSQNKSFPLTNQDMGNIRKFVIANMTDGKMYTQASNSSCNIQASGEQRITISGHLAVRNSTPYISNLRCSLN